MGIGATNPKGTDSSPARSPAVLPFRERGINIEGTVCEINLGIGL